MGDERLPSPHFAVRPLWSRCSLGCEHPQSSCVGHERPSTHATWSAVVHHKELRTTSRAELDRILQTSKSCICCDGSLCVSILQVPVLTKTDAMFLSALYTIYLLLTIISLYPNKSFRNSRSSKISDGESAHQPWEMMDAPRTPGTTGGLKSPTTPRTTAFNTLSGNGKAPVRQGNQGIPLRHHIGMGNETYNGPSGK